MRIKKVYRVFVSFLLLVISFVANSTNYTVTTAKTLQSKMNAALPGDTVIVAKVILLRTG